MEDKATQIALLRILSFVLLALCLGMLIARQFGVLNISIAVIISLMTVAIANLSVAAAIGKKDDVAD
jgi:hypothetical protein